MGSFLGLDLSRNYSIFMVPAAFLTVMLPHYYAILASKGTYDNANPRGHQEHILNNEALDKARQQRVLRAKAAVANGFETIGLFAAGVAAANHAGVAVPTLNLLTMGYVAARLAYDVVYIWLQANRRLAFLRTTAWLIGVFLTLSLWMKAGYKVLER
ncbi:hypothetical protein BKA56DRAFT_603476 [Ilyonectria sp. MPI-CAGE-AT-0026]|nr:hypothetical protein BKA56DRAFT_603476 [Ilyonectria sp. MPI-CAGE-AT-0026]